MSIHAWLWDRNTFGQPDWGLEQSVSGRQFTRTLGEVAEGQYRDLNPTDGAPLTLQWDMTDTQYQSLVDAWGDVNKLAWGNNWFVIDLPLQFDHGWLGGFSLYETITKRFAMLVGSGTQRSGLYQIQGLGEVTPSRLDGEIITDMLINRNVDFAVVKLASLAQLPAGQTEMGINFNTPDYGYSFIPLVWDSGNQQYQGNYAAIQPNLTTWLPTQDGNTIPVDVQYSAPTLQRYRVRFVEPYSAAWKGHEYWQVSASLEVDLTPGFETL